MDAVYNTIGLMSGSSLDGVDIVCCDLIYDGKSWDYRLQAADTVTYPPVWHDRLLSAHQDTMEQLGELDMELGFYYGGLLVQFMEKYRVKPALISSHGHTILHEPDRGITLQAGNGQAIADTTGIRVVSDFRREDVRQGGQGAPLVPVGDRLLFEGYDGCLNLGGIANISYEADSGKRTAFDICPVNMALNWLAGLRGLHMDRDGKMAGMGRSDPLLLAALSALDYYRAPPPKSIGREWFLSEFLPLIRESGLPPEDRMSTVVEHIALITGEVIDRQCLRSVLVTGGGALNRILVERLREKTMAEIVLPSKSLIHFKEAIIFALLGVLKVRNEINCLSSVTGGKRDLSAGTVHHPAVGSESRCDQ